MVVVESSAGEKILLVGLLAGGTHEMTLISGRKCDDAAILRHPTTGDINSFVTREPLQTSVQEAAEEAADVTVFERNGGRQ